MRGSKGGLDQLKDLRKELQQARQREAEAARLPAARAGAAAGKTANRAGEDDGRADFRRAMGSVRPLKRGDAQRVQHGAQAPTEQAAALRRHAAGEAGLPTGSAAGAGSGPGAGSASSPHFAAALSDADVTHLLTDHGTAYVHPEAAPDSARRLRRGQWRVDAEIDLHGLNVDQARNALSSFLDECAQQGARCVRVVHGKGLGSRDPGPVLRDKARAWLVRKPQVLAFAETGERDGGAGATLALLRAPASADPA
jgi:DNA-nicking Smr family endonuclease